MNLLVTGGCGYIGTRLVPRLLSEHTVTVYDLQWFGNFLKEHKNLRIRKIDIRDTLELHGYDMVIHLAAVANDPQGDLNPKLTWEINALATLSLADAAVRAGVKQFIYASSGSVYGVSSAHEVTEDVPLVPLTEYNKTKMVAERVLLSYSDKMAVQILRPATVCGLSPRMRLDVMVNALTIQALDKGLVKVFGGLQSRPNIHMDDMVELYLFMLAHPELTGIYNAGFENLTVKEIAKMVTDRVGCRTVTYPSIDARSYRLNSDKLLKAGFDPVKTSADAMDEIIKAYRDGKLKDEERWHNLPSMPKAA